MDRVGAVLISGGRSFHSLGAAIENALAPLFLSFDLGTTKRSKFADLRALVGWWSVSRSER